MNCPAVVRYHRLWRLGRLAEALHVSAETLWQLDGRDVAELLIVQDALVDEANRKHRN